MKDILNLSLALVALILLVVFFIPAFICKGVAVFYKKSLDRFVFWCENQMKEFKK